MKLPEEHLEPQRLVEEYFLRDFTEREIDELNAVLAGNPSLKAQFMRSLHDDLDLFAVMQHMQEERTLRARSIVPSRRKSAHTVRLNRINKIAAIFILLLSIGGLVYHRMNPPPAAVIADRPVESAPMEPAAEVPIAESANEHLLLKKEIRMVAKVTDLFLLDDNRISAKNEAETRPLHVGDLIGSGDVLAVPAGGRLSMKYLSDSTIVSFEEKSSFKILESKGAKHLELHDGRMVADVDKQEQGKPFRIVTDDAELVVLGTRFELMNREETILAVHSGEVQMNDLSDDDTVSVPAGYYAESDKGQFTKPVEFQYEKLKPIYSRTLPGIPKKHKQDATAHIIVDSERNLRGRLDFIIPRMRGRISEATLHLRIVPFGTDKRGGGTVRVKRAERKNTPDMGRHSGEVRAGMDLIFTIDPTQLSKGKNKLLLEMDKGGNDFWFGSKDSRHPPELHLTIIKD